jgi:hypothetical protein
VSGGEAQGERRLRITEAHLHPHLRMRMHQRGITLEEIERVMCNKDGRLPMRNQGHGEGCWCSLTGGNGKANTLRKRGSGYTTS